MKLKFPIFGLVLIAGGLFWAWDATHHDHEGDHGRPMTISEVQSEVTEGAFTADDGSSLTAASAACAGDGDESGGGFTHFRCTLTFAGGGTDDVVVHNLPDELMFSSSDSD